ncbi:MAG: 4-hydroxybenzoate octaprenyltransferase [Alphaproteobacteria bacterium]
MTNTVHTKEHTDIKRLIWVEKYIPEPFRPYAYLMRLDRPVGIWLLLLPGLWSIILSSGGIFGVSGQTFAYIILFTIGAIIMRGAGCVINDLWDRDLDKMVERTKNRPIASGIIPVKQAVIFLATLLLIGLLVLLQFNLTTIALGCATIPLIATYPLMKRITWWPQAFLGITFNFGILMGWSAVTGHINLATVLLYLGAICWTIGYDTIYAHQDKEDDAMAGIKSTALKFGNKSKHWISGLYFITILCFTTSILITKGTFIGAALIVLPALHLIWQIKKWEPDNQESSLQIFKSNIWTGILVLIAMM